MLTDIALWLLLVYGFGVSTGLGLAILLVRREDKMSQAAQPIEEL